jgi:hypothetical protein
MMNLILEMEFLSKSGTTPNYLPSSSESDGARSSKLLERNVITEEDVQVLKQKTDCWDTEEDV